jgi:hypothetical protein
VSEYGKDRLKDDHVVAYLLRFCDHVKVTRARAAIQLVAPAVADSVLNGYMRIIVTPPPENISMAE